MMTLKEKITLLLPQFDFKPNSWSLTFGLPHIGLGVMSRALTNEGANLLFDTGLFNALKFPPPSDYIRFNSQKNHRHLLKLFLLHNIKRDYKNHKLVFQESLLNVDLYEVLVREWGKPMSSFSLTCDYMFFKKMYLKKKPFNTENECKRVFKLCTEMITKIPSKSLRIDRAVSLSEFEEFMSSRIAEVDRDRDPTNLFDY
jgi:hypothetical protein